MDSTIEMNSVDSLSASEETIFNASCDMQNGFAMFWYYANTRYGIVSVGLYKDLADNQSSLCYKNTVLDQIKTLAREEANIRLLEDWLEEGLDLRPDANEERFDHSFMLSNTNHVANSIKNTLIFKVKKETINKLPIPTWSSDHRLYLDSSCISSYISLSSNTICHKYIDLLKQGNVLLIPESFSNDWLGYAKASELNSDNIQFKIEDNLQTLYINNELKQADILKQTAEDQNNRFLQIVIDQEIQIPFHLLFGWTDKSHYVLQKSLNNLSIKIISDNACIAIGRLIPITNGYGVHIDEIY